MSGLLARGKALRRSLEGAFVGAVIGGAIAVLHANGAFEWIELKTLDMRMSFFANPTKASNEVVVLEVDDETVRWKESEGVTLPFDRAIWATLIDMLSSLDPKAIVFDVTFGDRRESAVREVFNESFSSSNVALGDAAWRSNRVVVGISTIEQKKSATRETIDAMTGRSAVTEPYFSARLPPASIDDTAVPEKKALEADESSHLIRPEEFVLVGTRTLGYVDTAHVQDVDGALRRFAPLTRVSGEVVPELSVAGLVVAAASTAAGPVWLHPDPPSADSRPPLPAIEIRDRTAYLPGGYEVPLRDDGTAWIRWRGHWQKEPALRARTIGAKYLLSNHAVQTWEELGVLTENAEDQAGYEKAFKDKIVVIGFTIQGEASDFTQTPFGPQPGVFRYASTLDTVLTGSYIESSSRLVDGGLIVLLSVIAGIAGFASSDLFRRRAKRPTLIASGAVFPGIVLFGGYVVASFAAFQASWIVNLAPTLLSFILVTLVCATISFALAQRESLEEAKRKEHFFNLARQGLGRQVVDDLLKQGENAIPKAGGERKTLTLYFSDIAGFTTISEKLEPIELVNILNEYFEKVAAILVNKHHGYLDKFIGDAVMASWGGFGAEADGPVRACNAALDARDLIREFSDDLERRGLPPLRTRIGLNSGTAVAAWVGLPGERWYYTAFGDTVNLASRLEGANKAYGTSIMIGPITYEQAKHAVVARELDLVRVKGKKLPVHVYELMCRIGEETPAQADIKRRYEAALAKFRARDFSAAKAEFDALIAQYDDSPSKTYTKYCEERIKEPPPPDWDGSNELHEK